MILIADDNDLTRYAVGRLLRRMGETTCEAENGDQVMAALGVLQIEIVLSDYVMPRGGAELRRRITEAHPRIPVILMSGLSPEHFFDQGWDAFVGKPIDRDELKNAITYVRSRPRSA